MRQVYSDVIQFRGNHYDFGYMQGRLLKDSLILKNRKKQRRRRKQRYYVQVQELKNAMLSFSPGIWEELLGLRDGLNWSFEKTINFFGGYLSEYRKSGCTVFTGSDYMIRNYDFHPNTYEGRFILFQPTNKSYATIGPTQNITGRMDGLNEKGLTIAYNFINRKKPGTGFIPTMIARIVLESCANVDEAIALLKEIPHFHSFSYIIFDQSETTYIVEATPRGVEIRTSHICTNHFELLTHENRYHLDDSYRRMNAILSQQDRVEHAYDAFQMLNGSEKGVFSSNYQNSNGTIHTSAYFPNERKMWFALGGDREPFIIDFKKWLLGDNMNIKRMLGSINTDEPFLHMEKI